MRGQMSLELMLYLSLGAISIAATSSMLGQFAAYLSNDIGKYYTYSDITMINSAISSGNIPSPIRILVTGGMCN